MIKATISPANKAKVIIGPVRLSYCHLFKPHAAEGAGEPKYQTTILIPKSETEAVSIINKAVEAAKKKTKEDKWGGSIPMNLTLPLRDGDTKPIKAGSNIPDPVFKDCWYLNAKSNSRPSVLDRNKQPLYDEEEVYSGMWAYVSISFFGYKVSGKYGVSVGLENVMKYKDGERLGGKASAEDDFRDVDTDFDNESDEDL